MPLPNQSYEKDDPTQCDITFERDLNLQVLSRTGYTLLDLIANVGGLRAVTAFVIGQFFNYWSFNSPANYMVQRLYTYRKGRSLDYSDDGSVKDTKKIFFAVSCVLS